VGVIIESYGKVEISNINVDNFNNKNMNNNNNNNNNNKKQSKNNKSPKLCLGVLITFIYEAGMSLTVKRQMPFFYYP
jgi:hypothetical protein